MNFTISKGFIYGIIQAILFIAIYYLSLLIALKYHTPRRMGPAQNFGYHAFKEATFVGFGLIVIISNIVVGLTKSKLIFWILYSLMFIAFIYYHGSRFDYVPYKSLHWLTTGLFGLLMIFPIKYVDIIRKKRRPNSLYIS